MAKKLPILPVWERWKELTQFLALTDHVLLSQQEQWKGLPIADKDNAKIVRQNGPYKFETDGRTYDAILSDRHVLSSVVLLNSYALVESLTRQVYDLLAVDLTVNTALLNDVRSGSTTIHDVINCGGIEVWGTTLLKDLGRDWGYVETGLPGLIEVAVVRNGIAHGEAYVTQKMMNRITSSGGTLPWPLGAEIKIDIAILKEYRHRLRSFARVIEHGAEELS
jgi:hypothetical protein